MRMTMSGDTDSRTDFENRYRVLLGKRFALLQSLGLPSYMDQDGSYIPLDALYVSTRVQSRVPSYLRSTPDALGPDEVLTFDPAQELRERRWLVVLGGPGSGKSTLVQMAVYSLCGNADSSFTRVFSRSTVPIPI